MLSLMFRRPTITKLIEDELYDVQRRLLNAEAGLLHARITACHHEANVRVLHARCHELRDVITRNQAAIL